MSFYILDRTIAFSLNEFVKGSKIRFSRVYNGKVSAEIVILGDSRGVNSIYAPDVTKTTGKQTFNLSYNGMSIVIANALWYDYLEKNPPPKLLLLEVTNVNSNSKLVNNLTPYLYQSNRLKAILKERNPAVYWACQISHLYRFNGEMTIRALYYLRKSDQNWINRNHISEKFAKSYSPYKRHQRSFDSVRPDSAKALKSIIRRAQGVGVTVRLFIGPYLPAYLKNTDRYSDWKREVQQLADGLPLWDYGMALKNIEYFADPLHMNLDGERALLSRLLIDGFYSE
jgi:hypothetical protein